MGEHQISFHSLTNTPRRTGKENISDYSCDLMNLDGTILEILVSKVEQNRNVVLTDGLLNKHICDLS